MFTRVELVERRFPRLFVPIFGSEANGRHWSCRHSENRTSNRVEFPIQISAAKRRVKQKGIFTLSQCLGDSDSLTLLIHPAILNQLSPHLAPVSEPNFSGRGVFS